jgi:hypothetical protein
VHGLSPRGWSSGLSVFAMARSVGLWRAEVLGKEVIGRRVERFSERQAEGRPPRYAVQPTFAMLVGDDSGARTEVMVPYDRRCAADLIDRRTMDRRTEGWTDCQAHAWLLR